LPTRALPGNVFRRDTIGVEMAQAVDPIEIVAAIAATGALNRWAFVRGR